MSEPAAEHWVVVRLESIVASSGTGLVRSNALQGPEHDHPYIRMNHFDSSGRWNDDKLTRVSASDDERARYELQERDLLFNTRNSAELVGKVALWPAGKSGYLYNNNLLRVRFAEASPSFMCFQMMSPVFRKHMNKVKSATTSVAAVYQRDLWSLPVAIAPLPEQHRIVAEIEKQFTRLDAAVASLERVKANLKRARASVLKSAVEGRLVPTEAELARAEDRDYEPASVLLERILEERKRKHEETAGKKKYKEPVGADEAALPELPEGWAWAAFEEVLENHDGARVPVKRDDRAARQGAFRYYGASGAIDTIDGYTHDGSFLLIGEDGANLLARSKPIAFRADGQFWVNNHAHVLLPFGSMPLGYFEAHINSLDLSPYVTGSAQPKLPQRAMNKIPLGLPPLAEQLRIVAEVERRLSVLDALTETVATNLARCARLRQSILKRAFEGKLVPQDPTDEPASELLARIQAQAPPLKAKKRAKKKTARKRTTA